MTLNLSNEEVARLIKSELLSDELPLGDEYSSTPDSQLDSKIECSDLGIYEEIKDDFIKGIIWIEISFKSSKATRGIT